MIGSPGGELADRVLPNGGNPVDAAHAARKAWHQVLRFLNDNLACTLSWCSRLPGSSFDRMAEVR
jgi:hypothetical protein